MTNLKIIISAFVIVLLNIVASYYFMPTGMMLTPINLIIVSSLILFCTNDLKLIWKSLLILALIVILDIGIKLFAGGTQDTEGLGWINLILILGLLPTFGILLTNIILNKQETAVNKLIALLIFPIFICIYLYFFYNLGLNTKN